MNSILENTLVRKYFKDDCSVCRDWPVQGAAWHVLTAMQEPIKKGERVLSFYGLAIGWIEAKSELIYSEPEHHPYCLRLPDRFQKQECDILGHPCERCGATESFHRPKAALQKDALTLDEKIEEKVDEIVKIYATAAMAAEDVTLYEGWKFRVIVEKLVALAKGERG